MVLEHMLVPDTVKELCSLTARDCPMERTHRFAVDESPDTPTEEWPVTDTVPGKETPPWNSPWLEDETLKESKAVTFESRGDNVVQFEADSVRWSTVNNPWC